MTHNTLIANLRHAARNRETVTIGGGEFGPAELLAAARALESQSDLLEALQAIIGHDAHLLNEWRVAFARGAIKQATGE